MYEVPITSPPSLSVDSAEQADASPHLSTGYRPEVDGLRAVAVLAVLINHINHHWLPGGFLGVDLFFVISGYVVTSSLARRKEVNWRQMLSGFYTRRFRRLIPALLLMVALVSLLFSFIVPKGEDLYTPFIRTGLASLFGVSNIYLLKGGDNYFDANTQYNPFLHTWSLGVEEQFYLLWPLIVMLAGVGFRGSQRRSLKVLLSLTLAMSVVSFLLYLKLSTGAGSPASFYLMPARFWELSAGAILYLTMRLLNQDPSQPIWASNPLLVWGMFLIILIAFALPLQQASDAKPLFVLAATVLLAGLRPTNQLGRWLSHPFSLSIGVSSYSLYLWHWPLIVFLRWTVGFHALLLLPLLALIAVFTYVSYQVEVKFRFCSPGQPQSIGPLKLYPFLSLLTGLFVLSLGRWPGQYPYLGSQDIDYEDYSNSKRVNGTSINTANCFAEPTDAVAASQFRPLCLAVTNPNLPTLFFEGDSHTNAIIPLAGLLYNSGYFNVSVFAKGGCVVPSLNYWSKNRHLNPRYQTCGQHALLREKVMMSKVRPGDQIILVNFLAAYLGDDRSIKAYEEAVSRLAGSLREKEAGLIIFAPSPVFSDRAFVSVPLSTCFATWFRPSWALSSACQATTVPRADVILENQRINAVLRRLEAKHTNIRIFDPLPHLCPPSQALCSSDKQGKIMFFDTNHLTNFGARSLFEPMVDFLKTKTQDHL